MEVKKGYKKTEVGVIPEDWFCKSVGELCRDSLIHKPMDDLSEMVELLQVGLNNC
jgi:hypothetical protein